MYLIIMKKGIVVIFLFFFTWLYADTSAEIYSKLEDDLFFTRCIYHDPSFSFAVNNVYNAAARRSEYNFSFYSDTILAGRIIPAGVWQEFFNPFGYSADSAVYKSETGMEKNFNTSTGGMYGFSLNLPFSVNLSYLYRSYSWAGLSKKFTFNDGYSLSLFFSAIQRKDLNESKNWIEDYRRLSVSEPIYTGMKLDRWTDSLNFSLLTLISGDQYYRSGFFSRSVFGIIFPFFNLHLLFMYADKDYILPTGESEDDNFMEDSRLELTPYSWLSVVLEGKYCLKHALSYPAGFVESSGSIHFTGMIKLGLFKFELSSYEGFNFFSSGIDETFRGWNGTFKVKLSPSLITLSGGEKRVDGLIYQRRGSLEFFFLFSDFYAAAVFSLLSDTSQNITITGEGKLSVGIKLGTGELFFSYDGSLMLSQNRKGFFPPEHFRLGWKSRFVL